MAEARDSPARSFIPKLLRGDGGPSELSKWLKTNGSALLMLTFIFLLALFVRSYFAFELSADNDYIVSGGSDSYYWRRIIEYHFETGENLFDDPMLNYPISLINPRPPFYSMSVAIPAVLTEGLFSSSDDAIGFYFVWSTAFWGAMTVIPVYFLGKETFGRRAGMAAAFFFAIIPAHVQRSVLSNADHDALILFLVVLVLYFLLKAIKSQDHRRWVENWRSGSSIASGLKSYFSNSRTALLYTLMAGTAYAALMMTWVGFSYVTVLILAYYVVQLLVNMFRNQDSTSVTLIILLAMGFGYLMAFPYYANYIDSFFNDRFLVPVLLWAGAMVFGIMFVLLRDLPWTLSLPSIVGLSVGIIAGVSLFYPWLGEAIMTGQGYFSQSKLYTTIAEARAPEFSELALSFGMVTFFLSLIGLIYALLRIPKRSSSEYIFMVVWLTIAIFMAISAGRFMFNAAPAFAIAAGWVLMIMVDSLDFNAVRKSISGASGSFITVFRKSIKIRHIMGVLFLGFLILLPNVWYSVDAGIPSETKRSFDKEIYFSIPDFMRPSGYDEINGSNWYLGAFGYSLPLPSYYYPAAWDWFSEQDADIYPLSSRPAYVAWWDYGFEAVAEGDHPTVADNFQNGYEFTGNFIMAQSEPDAVSLFSFRLIQTGLAQGGAIESALVSVLEKYDVDVERMHEIVSGPAQPLIDEVLSDRDVYGPMSNDLSAANARIVAGRVELSKLDIESLVSLYADVCEATGWEIRYFNVDSRMFPISGYETGIFYAPAKLSDRRFDGSIPIDFYRIVAVDNQGVQHELDELTADMTLVSYDIVYEDMFYDSMFYRAMCGISGADIGLANEGLPGVSGVIQKNSPMPAWNLTHFRVVYRTAYYNPYPSDEVAYHSSDWRAVSYEEARSLREQISDGDITGVVDDSASSLYRSGTVFLKYYRGAYVNGTITTEEGYPAEGLWVTVQDEFGIPHQLTATDSEGRYSLLAPFGNVTVVVSQGAVVNQALIGSNVITRMKFNVTDDQAMRVPQDLDGNGVMDYIFTKDFVMRDSKLTGDLYWDNDKEGNFTAATDDLVLEAEILVTDLNTGMTYTTSTTTGTYELLVPPGRYDVYALLLGSNLTIAKGYNVTAGDNEVLDLAIEPAALSGYLLYPDGTPASFVELFMQDVLSDAVFSTFTTSNGSYKFDQLLTSKYSMSTSEEGMLIFSERFSANPGISQTRNVTLWEQRDLNYRIVLNGTPAAYSTYIITDDYDPYMYVSGIADKFGWVRAEVPVGVYTLHAQFDDATDTYSGMVSIDLTDASASGKLSLEKAYKIVGGARGSTGAVLKGSVIMFVDDDGARTIARTDSLGSFDVVLPAGTYEMVVNSQSGSGVLSSSIVIESDITGMVIDLDDGVRVSGTLFGDLNGDGLADTDEILENMGLIIEDIDGNVYLSKSSSSGFFSFVLPKGVGTLVSICDPAYSLWAEPMMLDESVTDTVLIAYPDPVTVQGQVRLEGAYLSDVDVLIASGGSLEPAVTVTTDAYGRFAVSVVPGSYQITIDSDVEGVEGAYYQYDGTLEVEPQSEEIALEIAAELRINLHGLFLGATADLHAVFTGPERVELDVTDFTYSVDLVPGTYSIYGTGWIGSVPYASLELVDIGPSYLEHDVQLERAYEVSGLITRDGKVMRETVSVLATSLEGISVLNASDRFGTYSLPLPVGQYSLSFLREDVDFDLDGFYTYVEYYYDTAIEISGHDLAVNPSLLTRMDNATFSGTVLDEDGNPIVANVRLIPNDEFGQDMTVLTTPSGQFSVWIQPGEYTVYITKSTDSRVSLSTVELPRNVDISEEFQLVQGQSLEGRITVADAPVSQRVSISSSGSILRLVSDASGGFNAFLPPGSYQLSASTTRIEGGMTVLYSSSRSVQLANDTVYVEFPLARDTKRSVTGDWNESAKVTAYPGDAITYVFKLENTGNILDTYVLSYSGTDFDVTFPEQKITIDFGDNGNWAYVTVDIVVGESVKAGNSTISVLARSDSLSSVRTNVQLVVKVAPIHSVSVENLNVSEPVSSRSTSTKFLLNNTGNVEDDFMVMIADQDSLADSGWKARIVDAESGGNVTNVTLGAFESKELKVLFEATRLTPDPTVEASVFAYSTEDDGADAYGSVPVMLPDVSIGPGGLDVVRDDVTFEYDSSRLYVDIALAVTLASMVAMFFIMRKRKGLGGGAKK